MATTVFLVRHAAHDRQDRVLVGRMPGVRLGPGGRAQAARVAARLRREPIAAVYSSPLDRARDTAEPIADAVGCPVRIADAVNEIDFGQWTGLSFDELAGDERWRGWNESRAAGRAPDGDSMAGAQARAVAGLRSWCDEHPDEAIVAVSHADVIKALVCDVLGLSLDRIAAFDIDPASITTVVDWGGGAKVLSLNERALAAGGSPS